MSAGDRPGPGFPAGSLSGRPGMGCCLSGTGSAGRAGTDLWDWTGGGLALFPSRSLPVPGESVLDISLLGRVHLLARLTLQKNGLDLGVEELPGLRIPRVQAVVVDQNGLVLEPVTPTCLADLLMHSLPYGVPEGGLFHLGCVFSATAAANGIHGDLGVYGILDVGARKDKAPKTVDSVKGVVGFKIASAIRQDRLSNQNRPWVDDPKKGS